LKILRVVGATECTVKGGLTIHIDELSRSLSEFSVESTLITVENILPNTIEPETNKVIRFKPLFTIFNYNSFSFNFVFFLFKNFKKYDIVHAHSHLFFTTIFSSFVKIFNRKIPYIITTHGTFSQSASHWLNKLFLATIGRWALNKADKVICYTEEEKELLKRYRIREKKIEIVPNGIPIEKFNPNPHIDKDIDFLFVGRLVEGKGVRYLTDAFKTLLDEFPDSVLTIVGNGPLKEELENIILNCNLQKNIKLLGEISYDKMPTIYSRSRIFVLPSFEEGMPRTMLEAMCCGVPVIVSDISQIKSLIENSGAGIIVPKKNTYLLYMAMKKLLCNKTKGELGKRGREYVIKNHSWEKTTETTYNLYKKVIKGAQNE